MKKTGFLIRTLGALALGVFCSCTSDDVTDPFAQDRNVSALDLPEIDSLVADSVSKGLYPDSLSGWELHWSKPLSTTGAQTLYVLSDSAIDPASLTNGSGDFDFAGAGLSAPLARLPVTDSVWKIPSSLLGHGRAARADKVFWFSVWVRYADGAVGTPVRYRFYLGDEYPPEIPVVDTVVGQTDFSIAFDRPRDMIGRFDETFKGRVDSIRALWWKGVHIKDSSGAKCDTVKVPLDSLRDTSVHRFHMTLGGMATESPYMVLLQFFDSAGNRSSLGPFPVKTHDDRIPSGASNGAVEATSHNRIVLTWDAASDSFANGSYRTSTAPNHRIGSYRVLLASPPSARFRAVDSVDLNSDSASFRSGKTWPSDTSMSRFRWNKASWRWAWPNVPPGGSFRLAIVVRDRSGNLAADTLFVSGSTKPITGIACPTGSAIQGLVPVQGNDTLGDFCIERFEHVASAQVVHGATWAEAIAGCEKAGGELCSEAQWQRACETEPGTSDIHGFGAIEVESSDDIDMWLKEVCGVGTGKADSLAANDTTRRDPRCVSAWGVRDMPGQMAEWTRDVWYSRRDTLKSNQFDGWNAAYLGASDYSPTKHGVLRGGSWLDISNLDLRKSLARCKSRTYAAFSSDTTLANGAVVRKPNPDGKASSFGYRCCYKPN